MFKTVILNYVENSILESANLKVTTQRGDLQINCNFCYKQGKQFNHAEVNCNKKRSDNTQSQTDIKWLTHPGKFIGINAMASSNIDFDTNVISSVDNNSCSSNSTKIDFNSNVCSGEQVCIYNVSCSPSVASSPSVLSYGFIPLQELSRIPSNAQNTQTHITDYV